jgi:hypothetical protein
VSDAGCAGYSSRPPQDRLGIRSIQGLNGWTRSSKSKPCSGLSSNAFARLRPGSLAASTASCGAASKPTPLVAGLAGDLIRSRKQLVAENMLLRQQLMVAARTTKRAQLVAHERGLIVLLARLVPRWREAMLLVRPETILRWHGQGFRLFWHWMSKARSRERKLPVETIALIRRMTEEKRFWGAERIVGELLKLGVRVAQGTVQRYMRGVRQRPSGRQTWSRFSVTTATRFGRVTSSKSTICGSDRSSRFSSSTSAR